MDIGLNELKSTALFVLIEHFIHPVYDFSLANWPTGMRAIALPGEELITQSEHADFQISFSDDAPFTVRDLVNLRDKNFCHVTPPQKKN